MSRIRGILFIAFLTATLLVPPRLSCGVTIERILATVNDEIVTLSEYKRFTMDIGIGDSGDTVDHILLEKLIEERIILQEATRKGIEVSNKEVDTEIEAFKQQHALTQRDFEATLAREGKTMENYRKSVRDKLQAFKLANAEVESAVVITDRDIADFYNAHKGDFLNSPEKVELKAIFLRLNEGASVTEITDLKRMVARIMTSLKRGESFEKLLSQYGDRTLVDRDGSLGEFVRGALIAPLDKRAFSMNEGEISEPLWVKDGVYILKLVKKTHETPKPADQVREDIRKSLYEQKRGQIFNEWVRSLWEKASVKIN
jgi:parvulin-like peptidyl-prolyl isomerase